MVLRPILLERDRSNGAGSVLCTLARWAHDHRMNEMKFGKEGRDIYGEKKISTQKRQEINQDKEAKNMHVITM